MTDLSQGGPRAGAAAGDDRSGPPQPAPRPGNGGGTGGFLGGNGGGAGGGTGGNGGHGGNGGGGGVGGRIVGPRTDPSALYRTASDTDDESGGWMMTYTDMVTLLLTVFVILVSLATFEPPGHEPSPPEGFPEQARTVVIELPFEPPADTAFQREFSGAPDAAPQPDTDGPEDPELRLQERLETMQAQIQGFLERQGLIEDIELVAEDRHLVVRMRDSVLFPTGSADLQPAGESVVARLAPMLQGLETMIAVEGHTDAIPIATALFRSNWELSASRAGTVVRRLIDAGVSPTRLMAVGYAETRPVASNATADGRAANRRVELILRPIDPTGTAWGSR